MIGAGEALRASLVAIRYNPPLKAFYRRLREAGKPAGLAIVAVMRTPSCATTNRGHGPRAERRSHRGTTGRGERRLKAAKRPRRGRAAARLEPVIAAADTSATPSTLNFKTVAPSNKADTNRESGAARAPQPPSRWRPEQPVRDHPDHGRQGCAQYAYVQLATITGGTLNGRSRHSAPIEPIVGDETT